MRSQINCFSFFIITSALPICQLNYFSNFSAVRYRTPHCWGEQAQTERFKTSSLSLQPSLIFPTLRAKQPLLFHACSVHTSDRSKLCFLTHNWSNLKTTYQACTQICSLWCLILKQNKCSLSWKIALPKTHELSILHFWNNARNVLPLLMHSNTVRYAMWDWCESADSEKL